MIPYLGLLVFILYNYNRDYIILPVPFLPHELTHIIKTFQAQQYTSLFNCQSLVVKPVFDVSLITGLTLLWCYLLSLIFIIPGQLREYIKRVYDFEIFKFDELAIAATTNPNPIPITDTTPSTLDSKKLKVKHKALVDIPLDNGLIITNVSQLLQYYRENSPVLLGIINDNCNELLSMSDLPPSLLQHKECSGLNVKDQSKVTIYLNLYHNNKNSTDGGISLAIATHLIIHECSHTNTSGHNASFLNKYYRLVNLVYTYHSNYTYLIEKKKKKKQNQRENV